MIASRLTDEQRLMVLEEEARVLKYLPIVFGEMQKLVIDYHNGNGVSDADAIFIKPVVDRLRKHIFASDTD